MFYLPDSTMWSAIGEIVSWKNGKEVPRWGVAEIQKVSPSTTGRCSRHADRECGTATLQPITTLLIFFGRPDRKLFLTGVPILP